MKVFRRPGRRSRSGWALLMVGLALFAGSTMTAVLLVSSNVTAKTATRHRQEVRAWYLAEGGVEAAKKDLLGAVAAFKAVPETGTVVVEDRTVEYSIEPTGYEDVISDDSGIQTIVTAYRIDARAEVEGHVETAHRVVNVEETPLFQFAVFYDDDLEVFPGPSMEVGGRVHSNGDMYLGSGATLTLNTNHVRAVGSIHRTRKDNPAQATGTVRIRTWVANPFDASLTPDYVPMQSKEQMSALGISTASGYDSQFAGHDANGDGDLTDDGDWLPWAAGALETWKGDGGSTVKSAVHGTSEAVPPDLASIKMFEALEGGTGGDYSFDQVAGEYVPVAPGTGEYAKGHYHASADLSILTSDDGTWTAYDGDGNDVSAYLAGAVKVTKILDVRQAEGGGQKVDVTEIDVDALNASGVFPENGLLYAAAYGAGTGTDAKGVVLKNGAELLAPLTVVTEDPIYVQGDYNTVEKKGAAVIADAVNLLSNAWDGSKTKSTLPKASETTYNLAFVTGNMATQGSAYNGGLENLPRFHESWGGVKCNLNGSFVNIWDSQHATGGWVYGGSYYTAPNRVYTYDEDFNDVANLPPFTPVALSGAEVVSW